MQVRNIILSGSAVVLLGAVLLLFLKVQASPAAKVPEQELAEARQRHERSKATRAARRERLARSRAITPKKRPVRRARPNREDRDDRDDRDEPGPPPPRPSIRGQSLAGMGQSPRERGTDLKERMDAVNRLYDHRDYEAALQAAREILAESPRNVRMLRVVVSSACIMGQPNVAMDHYLRLPPAPHQRHMRKRCARYGVDLPPPGTR